MRNAQGEQKIWLAKDNGRMLRMQVTAPPPSNAVVEMTLLPSDSTR